MDIEISDFGFEEFNNTNEWMNIGTDSSLQLFGDVMNMNDSEDAMTSSESLSPLSNSHQDSPPQGGSIDRQMSLLTDRPDTPLDSVCKFDDLSSGNDIFQDYQSQQTYALFDQLEEDLDTKMYFNSANEIKQESKCDLDEGLPTMVPSSSAVKTWYKISENKPVIDDNQITTNIKVEDTNDTFLYNHSPAVLQAKPAANLIDFKPQGIKRKLPHVLLYEPSMKASAVNMSTINGGQKLTIKRLETKPQPLKQVTTTSGLRVGHLVTEPAELKATSFPRSVNVNKNYIIKNKNGPNLNLLQNVRIKTEPGLDLGSSAQFLKVTPQQQLPPTPPSSSSSDSEHSSPRAVKQLNIKQYQANGKSLIRIHSNAISQASLTSQMLSSNQRLNQSSGPLELTEEEKKTLQAEGYDIPTSFPLSKVDERNLKKVRRKIKNKISAQESRRKKKEYLEMLEKQMDKKEEEANSMKRKVKELEEANGSLLQQVRNLQQLLTNPTKSSGVKNQHTQTSSCMMMLCLSFVFFVSGWLPILGTDNSAASGLIQNQEDLDNSGGVILPYNQEDIQEENLIQDVSAVCDVDKFFNNDYKGRVINKKKKGVGLLSNAAHGGGTKGVTTQQQQGGYQLVTKQQIQVVARQPTKMKVVAREATYDKGRGNLANINTTGGQQQAVRIINVSGNGGKQIINAARRTVHDNQGKRLEVLIPLQTKNLRKLNLK